MDEKYAKVSKISVRLREAMDAAGKKQIDLVRETGIDKGSISNYLSGRYEPKSDALNELSHALGVSVMWLCGYDVQMTKHEELLAYIKSLSAEEAEQAMNWLKLLNGLTENQKVYVTSLLEGLFGKANQSSAF